METNNNFWQNFAANHPALWAFIMSFVTRFKNTFPKKNVTQNTETIPTAAPAAVAPSTEDKSQNKKVSNTYGFNAGEAVLLLLQLALMLGALWLLWHVVVLMISTFMVVGLAIIGVVLNFVAGIAVPDLPQMLPNAFHLCEWAMSFIDAMITPLVKSFCEIFENGIPTLRELITSIRNMNFGAFMETAHQFWSELLKWAASL